MARSGESCASPGNEVPAWEPGTTKEVRLPRISWISRFRILLDSGFGSDLDLDLDLDLDFGFWIWICLAFIWIWLDLDLDSV